MKQVDVSFGELGFEETWGNDGYAGFRNGDAKFILQNFYDEAFAQNLMIRIDVPNLDVWWQTVSRKSLEKGYPGFRINPGCRNTPFIPLRKFPDFGYYQKKPDAFFARYKECFFVPILPNRCDGLDGVRER